MSFLENQLIKPLPVLIKKYFRENNNVDSWEKSQIKEYQKEALTYVINHAFENNPFYRQKYKGLPDSPENIPFEELPFLDREEIMNNPWILLSTPKNEISQVHISTGSSGQGTIYIDYSWDDLYVRGFGPSMRKLVPVGIEDVIINALPYELSSAGLAFHRVFQKACGACVIPAGKGGAYSKPEKTVQIIQETHPTILITTPSYAVYLKETADSQKISLKENLFRFIWLTGEGCSPSFRKRVEGLWGCPAYFYYGSLEAGPIGIECPTQNGYHIALGHIYLEIIDQKTERPLPPGETGEIIVTELIKESTHLVRYRTGDIGFIDDSECPCGISLPRLYLRGRKEDQIMVGGEIISPFFIEEILMQIDEVGYWYQICPQKNELLLRIELKKDFSPDNGIKEKIQSYLEYFISCPVKVEFSHNLPRSGGKIARVIWS